MQRVFESWTMLHATEKRRFRALRSGPAGSHEGPQGARLEEVGNSGNSSEPHLHLHAQTPGRANVPIAGVTIPFRIDVRYVVHNEILLVLA